MSSRTWSRSVLILPTIAILAGAAYLTVTDGPAAGAPDDHALGSDLDEALERARASARLDGVEIVVTSGRRSWQVQQDLWEQALARHGSASEARRWVLPPEESAHVSGEAIDVAAKGSDWLVIHGAEFGLCQRYANEWWHFEMLTEPGGRCPALQPDAAGGVTLLP